MHANRVRYAPESFSPLYFMCSEMRPGVIPFRHLRNLRLSDGDNTHKISLLLFPPRLRRLRVQFNWRHGNMLHPPDVYLCVASRQVPRLEQLKLTGYATPTSLMCVSEFKCLQTLDLRGYDYWMRSTLPPVPRDATLRYLLLSISEMKRNLIFSLGGLEDHDIPNIARCGFHTLEVISISAHPDVGDVLATEVARNQFRRLFRKFPVVFGDEEVF